MSFQCGCLHHGAYQVIHLRNYMQLFLLKTCTQQGGVACCVKCGHAVAMQEDAICSVA